MAFRSPRPRFVYLKPAHDNRDIRTTLAPLVSKQFEAFLFLFSRIINNDKDYSPSVTPTIYRSRMFHNVSADAVDPAVVTVRTTTPTPIAQLERSQQTNTTHKRQRRNLSVSHQPRTVTHSHPATGPNNTPHTTTIHGGAIVRLWLPHIDINPALWNWNVLSGANGSVSLSATSSPLIQQPENTLTNNAITERTHIV